MKLRKIMMVAGLTAAIASMSVFGAFAAEDDDIIENVVEDVSDDADSQSEWYSPNGSTWYYYVDGVMATNMWIDGGTRNGDHYWYYVGSDGVMLANTTQTINGKSYSFDEDGTYVEYYSGAPTGTVSGNTFFNTWSNLRIEGLVGEIETDTDHENDFTDSKYNSIGNPRLTMDLYIDTSAGGTLEVYYLNVSAVANMSAADFANAFAQVGKGTKWTASGVSTATIAGQEYAKVSFVKSNGAQSQQDYYFRKLGSYMVVIYADGDKYCMDYMDSLVNSFVPAN